MSDPIRLEPLMIMIHDVVVGNWNQNLWKISQCFHMLSHLSSPQYYFCYSHIFNCMDTHEHLTMCFMTQLYHESLSFNNIFQHEWNSPSQSTFTFLRILTYLCSTKVVFRNIQIELIPPVYKYTLIYQCFNTILSYSPMKR